jgi:hypothetical protein
MKITKTITVDLEVWEEAQTHIDNLSSYVNECLKSVNGRKSQESLTRDQLEIEVSLARQTIKDASMKELLALNALKDLEASKVLKAKELAEDEQFKRWNCGACHHLNFMDQDRCAQCHLPTKTDSKTTIISIKGE